MTFNTPNDKELIDLLESTEKVLLAKIKAGNSWYKLKNEIKQILYLLHQHNKITKILYKNLIKSL